MGWKRREVAGKTLIIARTEKGLDLINSLQDVLSLDSIDLNALKSAVDWKKYKRKLLRMDVYNKSITTSVKNKCLVTIADQQRHFLEHILNYFSFPQLILKIFRKLPLADDWIK